MRRQLWIILSILGCSTANAQHQDASALHQLAQTCNIQAWKHPSHPRYEHNIYQDGDKIAVQYRLTAAELSGFCISLKEVHAFDTGVYDNIAGQKRKYTFAISDSIMWLRHALLEKHKHRPEMQIELSKMYNVAMVDWNLYRKKAEEEVLVYAKNRCKEQPTWCSLTDLKE